MPPRPSRRAAVLAIAAALCLLAGDPAFAGAYPSLFGTSEDYSSNLALFRKWNGAVERYRGERENCVSPRCDKARWKKVIDDLRGAERMAQLAAINTAMNEYPYILDDVNWGVPDYWATPFEFLRRSGDCEDYAIAKYMALRALGVGEQDLRVVVLRDLNLQLGHAVLAVYLDDRALILDNQIKKIVPAEVIRHYQPIYSINENGWWLHRP